MLFTRIRKIFHKISTLLKFRDKKRFSTYLVATFVTLATVSVFVILIALYGFFGKRVES